MTMPNDKELRILDKIKSIDLDKVEKLLEERRTDIDEKLSELQDMDDKVSDWEIDFINSCTDQFEQKNNLTDKQYEIILKIYCKHCL